jgi:hypothetical protein
MGSKQAARSHRLAVTVPLAAVLLAASAVTGCSTATRPAAR